jgi:hypothetical protein
VDPRAVWRAESETPFIGRDIIVDTTSQINISVIAKRGKQLAAYCCIVKIRKRTMMTTTTTTTTTIGDGLGTSAPVHLASMRIESPISAVAFGIHSR